MTDSPPIPAPLDAMTCTTFELLKAIVSTTKVNGVEYKFVCPRGQGDKIMARVRMMLSRTRQKMYKSPHRMKQFRLMSRIVPLVNTSKELVIVWQNQGVNAKIDEAILRALSLPLDQLMSESK